MSFPYRFVRRLNGLLALALAATLPACGGGGSSGGGGGTIPAVQTVTVFSTAAKDGYLTSSTIRSRAGELVTGDEEGTFGLARGGSRSFLHFEHPGLPAGATVQSAILRVRATAVVGTPIGTFGPVVVDHVGIGADYQPSDFNSSTLTANIGTLMTQPTVGFKEVDVTAAFLADRGASRTASWFRIQHANADEDSDGGDDYVYWESADDTQGTGDLPELVITVQLP